MALTRTNQIGAVSAAPHGTGAFTTGSFTPPNNSLLVVIGGGMESSGTTDPSGDFTIAGGGWTFTSRAVIGMTTTWTIGIRIWTAPVATGASMTLAMDAAARNMQFLAISAVAYTDYDAGSPTGATATANFGAGPDGAKSMTLSGAPATTSEVFAGILMDKEFAGTTPGATYTEIHEVHVGNSGGLQSEIRAGSSSTTVDWVDTHTGAGVIFSAVAAAVEIKQGGGGIEGPHNSNAIDRMGLNLAY